MAAPDDQRAPTSALYVDLPFGQGLLQMCVMRPEPKDVCPELPFFVPPPPAASDLHATSLMAKQLPPAEDLLLRGASAAPPDNPLVPPCVSCHSVSERRAVLHSAREQARCGRQPTGLAALRPADWAAVSDETTAAAASEPECFADLDAAQLLLVVQAARSEALCDLLLFGHALRQRILRAPRPMGTTTTEDIAPSEAEAEAQAPLPGALSDLLLALLHGGSALRLPAADFDAQIVQPLLQLDLREDGKRPMGTRGATQAALIFAAAVQQQQQHGDGMAGA